MTGRDNGRDERHEINDRYDKTARNDNHEHTAYRHDDKREPNASDGKQDGTETPAPPSAIPPPPPSAPPPGDSPPLPPSPPRMASKMDKYFNTSYDPRLDLGEVPAEGLIQAVGWDGMLEVLKERGRKVSLHSSKMVVSSDCLVISMRAVDPNPHRR